MLHAHINSPLDHSVLDNGMPITVTGLASDLLENARRPDGKILNGLEFVMWKDAGDKSLSATDLVAWDYLRGKRLSSNPPTHYPIEDVRWGLAATANSVSWLHIDSDGFATYVQVMCGKKVWGVYCPSPDLPLDSINVFLDPAFHLDDILEESKYGLEAVVLRQGDLL